MDWVHASHLSLLGNTPLAFSRQQQLQFACSLSCMASVAAVLLFSSCAGGPLTLMPLALLANDQQPLWGCTWAHRNTARIHVCAVELCACNMARNATQQLSLLDQLPHAVASFQVPMDNGGVEIFM